MSSNLSVAQYELALIRTVSDITNLTIYFSRAILPRPLLHTGVFHVRDRHEKECVYDPELRNYFWFSSSRQSWRRSPDDLSSRLSYHYSWPASRAPERRLEKREGGRKREKTSVARRIGPPLVHLDAPCPTIPVALLLDTELAAGAWAKGEDEYEHYQTTASRRSPSRE